jgi:hypothetical protein
MMPELTSSSMKPAFASATISCGLSSSIFIDGQPLVHLMHW